jgi:hypothetical protein
MNDYIGITFYPGTNIKRFESLLCSLLSIIEPSIKQDLIISSNIDESELMNFNDFLNGVEYEFPNIGKYKYDKTVKYENLKINVEFICDGIDNLSDELKCLIRKFNTLYYGNDKLDNLYGSKKHISVMCSRNYFWKKHKNDYKMILDDDDITSGLNNYKQYFNYARMKYNKFHGKINMIWIRTNDRQLMGTWSFIYLPSKTEIWQPINFMCGEDAAFFCIHQICKDIYVYDYKHEETKLPFIYAYINPSHSSSYSKDDVNQFDILYYFIMYILSTKSLIGANYLLMILYLDYCNYKTTDRAEIFKIFDKYQNEFNILKDDLKSIDENHEDFEYEYETRYLSMNVIFHIPTIIFNNFVGIQTFLDLGIDMDVKNDIEYLNYELIRECELIDFNSCKFMFKNILNEMNKRNLLLTLSDKSKYNMYRPDYIVEFENEETKEINKEFILDRDLRQIKINDIDNINEFNNNLLQDKIYKLYGGNNLMFILIFIVVAIVIIIIIIIVIITINKNQDNKLNDKLIKNNE